MKVRALQPGYDNLARRETDEVFDWPETVKVGDKEIENPIPDWCEPVGGVIAPPKGKQSGKSLA